MLNLDHLHLIVLASDRSQIEDRSWHWRQFTGYIFRDLFALFIPNQIKVGPAHVAQEWFRLLWLAATLSLAQGTVGARPGVTAVTA